MNSHLVGCSLVRQDTSIELKNWVVSYLEVFLSFLNKFLLKANNSLLTSFWSVISFPFINMFFILFWCAGGFSRFKRNYVDLSPYSHKSHLLLIIFLCKTDLIYICKKCIRNYPNNLQCILSFSFFFKQ